MPMPIAHFSMRCVIRTLKALGLRPRVFQALMKYFAGNCAISAWAWVLCYNLDITMNKESGSPTLYAS